MIAFVWEMARRIKNVCPPPLKKPKITITQHQMARRMRNIPKKPDNKNTIKKEDQEPKNRKHFDGDPRTSLFYC